MLTYAIATLFVVAGFAALLVIAAALRTAAPTIASLRRDLAACPERLVVTARIVETVARYEDGKVVRIPVRARLAPQPALRAAA